MVREDEGKQSCPKLEKEPSDGAAAPQSDAGGVLGAGVLDSPGAPVRLIRDVLLRDGSTLRMQAPGPTDYEDIRAFYEQLSPQSRYFRFHGIVRADTVARAAVESSGIDRVSLIARHGGRVIAACSYEGLREPGVAEIALAVADEEQRRGIGTRMLEQLAAIGAERGVRRFDAAVLSTNRVMLSVFRNAGFAVTRAGFDELNVSVDITPAEAAVQRIDERDHFAALASLRPILAPSSVAVIAADDTPGNIGRALAQNISDGGFGGVVELVDPVGSAVSAGRSVPGRSVPGRSVPGQSVPGRSVPGRSVRTLRELEVAPDLVILAVEGDAVLDFAAEAAAKGARALLIVPAGPERDTEVSSAVEARLLEIVRDAGLRLVGPNSLGVINTAPNVRLNATFTGASVSSGGLAICSPSGAVGIGLLGHTAALGLGVSLFASLGSRADVSTNDLLEWCEQDERTVAVILYVDTFGNPEHFTRIARRVSRHKPILAIKGRRSAVRVLAEARSHTAAALRGDEVFDALLHQAGLLRFRSGDELFNAAEFFERQPLPAGRRIGIVSNSVGVATIAADAAAARGLEVREADDAPNPLIMPIGAGPDDYGAGVGRLLAEPAIDALMVFYVDVHEGDPDAVLETISVACAGQPKPAVASVVRSDGRRRPRSRAGVPNLLFPESCANVLASAVERREWLSRPLGEVPDYADLDGQASRAIVDGFLDRNPAGGWISLGEAEALLATHGIPVVASYRCRQLRRAVAVAAEIGKSVVLKADFEAPGPAGEIDAVLRGLLGEAAIRAGWRELQRRMRVAGYPWIGALVQPLYDSGVSVLVGAVADPDLGPVLAVGLGGRQAGLGRSTAFRLLPLTDADADELIDASQSVAAELDGFRGSEQLDRQSLRELILRFALLLRCVPEVVEADLNPIRCMTTGCVVLDMRLRIERRGPIERVKTW
jgi:acyl-CoA synthetase (NDP forming)/RimJ/RimL family protein N-acetyltransferase